MKVCLFISYPHVRPQELGIAPFIQVFPLSGMETSPLLPEGHQPKRSELEAVDRNNLLWPWALATAISVCVGIWYLLGMPGAEDPIGDTEVHLAISPQCGSLAGSVADINVGIVLESFDTIVAFGVCTLRSLYTLLDTHWGWVSRIHTQMAGRRMVLHWILLS